MYFLIANSTQAQTLCGVIKIQRNTEFNSASDIKFDGAKFLVLTTAFSEGATSTGTMPKDKKISFSGKNPTSIVIEKGENIFVSDGLSRSCVIRGMEADGHEIFTIEEVVVNRGAAPTIKTEIVQRN
jgi:hypothetical protein